MQMTICIWFLFVWRKQTIPHTVALPGQAGQCWPRVPSLVNLPFQLHTPPPQGGAFQVSERLNQNDAYHLLSTFKSCHSFPELVLQLFSYKTDANRSTGRCVGIVDQYNEVALWPGSIRMYIHLSNTILDAKEPANPPALCKLWNAVDTQACSYQRGDYESLKGRALQQADPGCSQTWSKLSLKSEVSLRFTDFIIRNKRLETEGDHFWLPLISYLENAHRIACHLVAGE